MIYLNTPLPQNFRIYDAQVKWLAPGGKTPAELADLMLVQWQKHKTIKVRHGIAPTRDSALRLISENIRLLLNDQLVGFDNLNAPVINAAPRPVAPAKATRCCGGRR